MDPNEDSKRETSKEPVYFFTRVPGPLPSCYDTGRGIFPYSFHPSFSPSMPL